MKLKIPTIKTVLELYNHNNTSDKRLYAICDFPAFNELNFKFLTSEENEIMNNTTPRWGGGDCVNLLKTIDDATSDYIVPFHNLMKTRSEEADNINHSLQKSPILVEKFSTEQLQSYINIDDDKQRLFQVLLIALELDKMDSELYATYTFIHTLEKKKIPNLLHETLYQYVNYTIFDKIDIYDDEILTYYDHLINTINTDHSLNNYFYNDNIIKSLSSGSFVSSLTPKHHKIIRNVFNNAPIEYSEMLKSNLSFLVPLDSFSTNIFNCQKQYSYLINFDFEQIIKDLESKNIHSFGQNNSPQSFVEHLIKIMCFHNTYEYTMSPKKMIIAYSSEVIDENSVQSIATSAYKYFIKTLINKDNISREEFLQLHLEETIKKDQNHLEKNIEKNKHNNKLRKF